MMKINSVKNRIVMAVVTLAVTAGLIGVSVAAEIIFSRTAKNIPIISESVILGGYKYTADSPLRVLEIVPNESESEIGYMAGWESGSVRWSDILKLPEDTDAEKKAKTDIIISWAGTVTSYAGFGSGSYIGYSNDEKDWKSLSSIDIYDLEDITDKTYISYLRDNSSWQKEPTNYYYDYDGKTLKYNDNMFAYAVFSGYDMCDKVDVQVKLASEVTAADIDNAQYVYISNGSHNGNIGIKVYKLMYNAVNDIKGESQIITELKERYCKNDVNKYKTEEAVDNYEENDVDLSPEAALELVYKSIKKELSVSFDKNSVINAIDFSSYNIGKVFALLFGIDRDTLYDGYFANGFVNDAFTGISGSVYLEKKSETEDKTLEMIHKNKHLKWGTDMFIWGNFENNAPDAIYHSPTNYNIFTNENAMLYNGDNLMGNAFINGKFTYYNDFASGSTDEKAVSMYGYVDDYGHPIINNSLIIRYILGGYKDYREITELRVLEIDPAGGSKYNSYSGALKAAQYLGVSFSGMTEKNYKEFVKVTSVAANGFIAMTEDLKNNYDLIILTDCNETSNGKSIIKYSSPYTKYAEIMQLDNKIKIDDKNTTVTAAMSGNDFTDKSLNKIYDYINSGKPMVIADSIYNSNIIPSDSFITDSSGVNVYRLSKNNLDKIGVSTDNIMNESKVETQSGKLSYCFSADFSMDEQYKVQYDDGVVTATVSSDSLGNYRMTGTIGNYSNYYNMTIWFDKDGDGLFTSDFSGNSELYYNDEIHTASDGSFAVEIDLPDNVRGYVKWKAVVKEYNASYGTEDTGAIAIKYKENEKKTINVLQIRPYNDSDKKKRTNTLDMSSDTFRNLFNSTSETTGLKIKVKVVTSSDFSSTEYMNLDSYDMVVIGCADDFNATDISGQEALNSLADFIDKGRSVLFTHDTMIYSSYSDGSNTNVSYKTAKGGTDFTTSYNLTSKFRDTIGMDRFHASNAEYKKSDGYKNNPYQQGYSNVFLMKRANINSKRYTMYNQMDSGAAGTTSNIITNKVTKLNTGQVTEYPYQIEDTLTVADTHSQWFQLDLEGHNSDYSDSNEDIVVWYTLAGTDDTDSDYKYSNYFWLAGEDALNNYYIYSKGNITYSGAGHSGVNGTAELKLFVNTVVKAYASGNNAPQIVVNNAVSLGSNIYEKYIRSIDELSNMSGLTEEDLAYLREETKVVFTAYDVDMGASTKTKFNTGDVYWDVNGNGEYDEKDVILTSLEGDNAVYNLVPYSLYLYDYWDVKASNKTLFDVMKDNTLSIGIRVVDNKDLAGKSIVNVIVRDLFKLE